jgi:hypothetical protein
MFFLILGCELKQEELIRTPKLMNNYLIFVGCVETYFKRLKVPNVQPFLKTMIFHQFVLGHEP